MISKKIIILIGIVFFLILLGCGKGINNDKDFIASEINEEKIIKNNIDNNTIIMKIIDDKRCKDCNTTFVVEQLKMIPELKNATIIEKDFSDKGVSNYLKENSINKLPAFIFNTSNIEEQINKYLIPISSGEYNLQQGSTFNPFSEICNNLIDDNGDGKIDCEDITCNENKACKKEDNSIYPSNNLIKNLDNCIAYTEDFTHFFSGEKMKREILGYKENLCNYIEEMPNGGKMECKYTENMRKAIISYYKDIKNTESVSFNTTASLGDNKVESTYTINGKTISNPLQEAMNNGECIISGYSDLEDKVDINLEKVSHIDECYNKDGYDRTGCYINLGRDKKIDLEFCNKESDNEFKWYCYRGVGLENKDLKICDMIPDNEKNENKEWCYQGVAFNSEDESICSQIDKNNLNILYYCYTRLATKKKEPKMCGMYLEGASISQCEASVAKGTY